MKSQCAALIGAPTIVQVQDDRQHARIVIAKPIAMTRVATARRVDRIVTFELEQPELQRAISREAHRFKLREDEQLGTIARARVEPANAIATNADVRGTAGAMSDRCGRKSSGRVQLERSRSKCGNDACVDEFGHHDVAFRSDRVDQRRDRVGVEYGWLWQLDHGGKDVRL